MVKDFVKQYGFSSSASKEYSLLKSKSTESPKRIKEDESKRKVADFTLGHDKNNCYLDEEWSKDKGKRTISVKPNVSLLVHGVTNSDIHLVK